MTEGLNVLGRWCYPIKPTTWFWNQRDFPRLLNIFNLADTESSVYWWVSGMTSKHSLIEWLTMNNAFFFSCLSDESWQPGFSHKPLLTTCASQSSSHWNDSRTQTGTQTASSLLASATNGGKSTPSSYFSTTGLVRWIMSTLSHPGLRHAKSFLISEYWTLVQQGSPWHIHQWSENNCCCRKQHIPSWKKDLREKSYNAPFCLTR